MGRKAGVHLEDVVDAAAAIADREGLEAASLSAVAREIGIKTPSLYNHVDGAHGLRRQLAMRGAQLLDERIRSVASDSSGAEAIRAIADVNRDFAAEHPGLYASFLPAPRPGDDPELYEAMATPVHAIADVLENMGVARDESVHLIRGFRSLVHGFADLEGKDGFGMPVDIDESFARGVELLVAGIERMAVRADQAVRQP